MFIFAPNAKIGRTNSTFESIFVIESETDVVTVVAASHKYSRSITKKKTKKKSECISPLLLHVCVVKPKPRSHNRISDGGRERRERLFHLTLLFIGLSGIWQRILHFYYNIMLWVCVDVDCGCAVYLLCIIFMSFYICCASVCLWILRIVEIEDIGLLCRLPRLPCMTERNELQTDTKTEDEKMRKIWHDIKCLWIGKKNMPAMYLFALMRGTRQTGAQSTFSAYSIRYGFDSYFARSFRLSLPVEWIRFLLLCVLPETHHGKRAKIVERGTI